jgi:hypothetical protein
LGSRYTQWIARQITDTFPWDEAPDYLIRDRDGSYGHADTKRLSAMGIRDHPTAARSHWQNGHAERLIGSIRRECLDHIVIFGGVHLRRILAAYTGYYNELRTHLTLDEDSPGHRPVQPYGQLIARPILGGLHHQYCRDVVIGRDNGSEAAFSRGFKRWWECLSLLKSPTGHGIGLPTKRVADAS